MKIDPKLQAQLGQMFAAPQGERELQGQLLLVDTAKIETVEQPRKKFDASALKELENTIRHLSEGGGGIGGTGILQPLLVRAGESGNYLVVAGERRLRAAKAAGITQVPVVIQEGGSEESWEHAIIENLVRADLGPLEEAQAIQKLMQSRNYSVREAAKHLGKDKGYLENRLFLLKAPEDIREMVSARADTMRHAREISKIESLRTRQNLINASINGASLSAIKERVQNALTQGALAHNPLPNDEINKEQKSVVSARADTARPVGNDELAEMEAVIKKLKRITNKLPKNQTNLRSGLAAKIDHQIAALQKLATELKA